MTGRLAEFVLTQFLQVVKLFFKVNFDKRLKDERNKDAFKLDLAKGMRERGFEDGNFVIKNLKRSKNGALEVEVEVLSDELASDLEEQAALGTM